MSIKTTEYKYPLLMKGTSSGRIVLMTSYGRGTVVGTGNGHSYNKRLGLRSRGWAMHSFKPFKG